MAQIPDYPSNSDRSKAKKQASEERKRERHSLKPVAKADVKEDGPFKTFINDYLLEDLPEIKKHIMHDVIIPSIMDTLYKSVTAFFYPGESQDTVTSRSRVSYHNVSNNRYRDRRDDYDRRPSYSRDRKDTRSSRGYFEVTGLRNKQEALDIWNEMEDCIDSWDDSSVTLADLYDLIGKDSEWTDNDWGWTDLKDVKIFPDRKGWTLRLPRPKRL